MRLRPRSRWLRPGLLLLGAQAAAVGVWAIASPRSFYSDFPALGGSWVDAFPPFNEHLVRDVGGLFAGFAILFFLAAGSLESVLVRAALIAWLPFATLHFIFHVTHLSGLESSEKILQTITLGLFVVIPLAMLLGMRRSRRSTFL